MRVDELRAMRAPVFGLLVVLATDLLVTIAHSLGHRLASIRARQLNDEFAFAWLPVASTFLRLFLAMLLVGLLSTLWSRVRDQLRIAVRASAVVMTVAWIAQLLSAERFLLELGPACMGSWQFVIV